VDRKDKAPMIGGVASSGGRSGGALSGGYDAVKWCRIRKGDDAAEEAPEFRIVLHRLGITGIAGHENGKSGEMSSTL